MLGRPLQQLFGGPGIDDRSGIDPRLGRLLAAKPEPLELAGSVGVCVDAQPTPELDGEAKQLFWRVSSLRA